MEINVTKHSIKKGEYKCSIRPFYHFAQFSWLNKSFIINLQSHKELQHMLLRFFALFVMSLGMTTVNAQSLPNHNITIFSATDSTNHYANGVVITAYHNTLYCMWQSSPQDEDSDDTKVVFSTSTDEGLTWSKPTTLAQPTADYYCTSGGWTVAGDTLTAFIHIWQKGIEPREGTTNYSTTTDGLHWTQLQAVTMADGTPMQGVIEQDPLKLSDGRLVGAAHFSPGLHVCPIYTSQSNGHGGWHKAQFQGTDIGKTTRELEPSQYCRKDGSIVMIFRDQNSSFRKLASISTDGGISWSAPTLTEHLDARTKQCAGNLPDGTAYMVSCPSDSKMRWPLVLQLSDDGFSWNRTIQLRSKEELPPRHYKGRYKTLGYSYPKAFVWHNKLFIGYSVNKEDVVCTIVQLSF